MRSITVKIAVFLLPFFLAACAISSRAIHHDTETEQFIHAEELPSKVLAALPKEYDKKDLTYKRKLKNKVIYYEVNYEKDRGQFSITYDKGGKILEGEKKIEFSDIPDESRIKVEKILSGQYPDYHIIQVEKVYRHDEMLLEVFFSHPEAPTGFVEAIFDYHSCTLKEFVNKEMQSIQTHN